jgi:hypothetical protein
MSLLAGIIATIRSYVQATKALTAANGLVSTIWRGLVGLAEEHVCKGEEAQNKIMRRNQNARSLRGHSVSQVIKMQEQQRNRQRAQVRHGG